MKKTISCFICVLLLFCMMFPVSAANGKLTIENVAADPGQTVDVNILASSNPGIIAALIRVDYDASALKLIGADNGVIFPDGAEQFGKDTDSIPYTMLWEDGLAEENHTQNGILATLHFRVLDHAAAGKTVIGLQVDTSSVLDSDLNYVSFSTENGSVQISGAHAAHSRAVVVLAVVCAVAVCGTILIVVLLKKRKREYAV